jgi:hypothetical protein
MRSLMVDDSDDSVRESGVLSDSATMASYVWSNWGLGRGGGDENGREEEI